MRAIVCGGREYADTAMLDQVLGAIEWDRPRSIIFHGNARGADLLADAWARKNNVRVFPVPAEWAKHGKRAGPIRNQAMLGQSPDLVIAFPGGRGTADMVRRAKAAGVRVVEVQPPSAS